MLLPLAVVVVFAGVAVWRRYQFRAMTALTLRRRVIGPDGIVVGGEGFVLRRDDAPAVLLLHGAGDTPQSLRYLADALFARGFHVVAPLLPGHGRDLRAFQRITADALGSAVRRSYDDLRSSHTWVGVIGVSMGGALAVQLAAAHTDIPALGLVAPYLAMPKHIERLAQLSRVWGMVLPAAESSEGISVLDSIERDRNLAYGVFTPAGLRALHATMQRARAALPRVVSPTLVIQSREDNRIAPQDAEAAFARIGSRDKQLEWVTGAGHIITVDFGRDHVIARLAAFMEEHMTPRASAPRAGGISS